MSIILVSPHSYCNGLTYRNCDTLAGEVTKKLSKSLNQKGISNISFLADEPRPDCDLNRRQCRNTPFRQRLRDYINDNRDNINPIIFLLEIHSFPRSNEDWYGQEIILLDNNERDSDLLSDLYDWLKSNNVKVDIYNGKGNDIQAEFKGYDFHGLLIEFYEELSKQRLNYIINLLTEFLIE